MKLKKVKIENFRSLSNIEFDMKDYNVIFGKNNEGKSNILKALKRSWEVLSFLAVPQNERRYTKSDGIKLREYYFRETYNRRKINIENDIPIEIQQLKKTRKTVNITLIFELEEIEVADLNKKLTSTSKTTNYLEVIIYYDRDLNCRVSIKLKEGGKSLSVLKNIFITLRFLLDNFSVDYIPSIRTEEHSMEIIESIISQSFKKLEESSDYNEALEKINQLQSNVLNELSDAIEPELKKYLNSVKSVEIASSKQNLIRNIRNNYDIVIDDGKRTSLVDKGDGIKSLVALSLLQSNDGKNSLLMIDEPEAHLHSGAIKELKLEIQNESNRQQVIIASHHQIFVDRNNYSNNLILSSGRLKRKIDIRMIREELGVGLGENLLNAELIILVEGETDKKFLENYIALKNKKAASMIKENKIVIDVLRGTKNLESKLHFYNSGLCKCICILDNDEASKAAIERVTVESLIDVRNIFKVPLYEKHNSEIEDLYEEKFVFEKVDEFFNISNSFNRKSVKKEEKFTNKLKFILDTYGKEFSKRDEEKFKWFLVDKSFQNEEATYVSTECDLFLEPIIDLITNELKN